MLPFAPALDAFHARTAPADWLEGLVKAYVGDGIAADFYRAVAELVQPADPRYRAAGAGRHGHAAFVIARVRAAIATDPHLAGRLALWPVAWSGRRSPRHTGSSRTGARWPACWPGRARLPGRPGSRHRRPRGRKPGSCGAARRHRADAGPHHRRTRPEDVLAGPGELIRPGLPGAAGIAGTSGRPDTPRPPAPPASTPQWLAKPTRRCSTSASST